MNNSVRINTHISHIRECQVGWNEGLCLVRNGHENAFFLESLAICATPLSVVSRSRASNLGKMLAAIQRAASSEAGFDNDVFHTGKAVMTKCLTPLMESSS